MCKNAAEVLESDLNETGSGSEKPTPAARRSDTASSLRSLSRSKSIVIRRLPLQEAMKNGNSKHQIKLKKTKKNIRM